MKNFKFFAFAIFLLTTLACTNKHEHEHSHHKEKEHSHGDSHAHSEHKDHGDSHHHGNLSAHVHGEAVLNIALESAEHLSIELHIPGESVIGFEYKPKTEADKKKQAAIEAKIKSDFMTTLGFPTNARCEAHGAPSHSIAYEGDHHSEWKIALEVHCHEGIADKTLNVDFTKLFNKIETLRVQLIGDELQKALTLKAGKGAIELKQ
jgi:hypothetical protein